MNDWWINLALREKKMLAAGTIIVILFLGYELLWSPLVNANANLRTRVLQNQTTLAWMREADQRMQVLQKTLQKKPLTGSLLGVMQTTLNQSPLASAIVGLRQADNDAVEFSVKKFDFDQLMVFLTELWQKQGLLVSQITVMPGTGPGEVRADVVVKRALPSSQGGRN